MTKRGAIDKKGRTPSPKLLTPFRVVSLLEILDVGLAETKARIRHTLEHDHTHDAMRVARYLDEARAAAMDAATILRQRYLATADDNPEPNTSLLMDWDTLTPNGDNA